MAGKDELKQEQLEKVNGGGLVIPETAVCPHCGTTEFTGEYAGYGSTQCECKICGATWNFDVNGNVFNLVEPTKYEDPKEAVNNILKLRENVIKHFKS